MLLQGANDLETLIDANSPDLLLLDGREGPSRAELEKLKRGVAVTAVIDDGHERRLAADYAYYPPVSGAKALDWTGSHTLPRIGWEYALLGLSPNAALARAPASRPTVLVAMGGSDPHGLDIAGRQGAGGAGFQPAHPLCHRRGHEGRGGCGAHSGGAEEKITRRWKGPTICPPNMPAPMSRFAPSASPPMNWRLSASRRSIWA